ncbi:sigma-70 family RNA polymerase sigma factor [Staphylococcus americanisciuri]|uniref:RNA polymerase sigma factor SigS n=1 Tax=Staphylococcus americanisciuri TaxID=2973940 RepID=A0ABT2EYE5_9STAP|nr:sigma-70 family RNA polymerase sigma factor [Staphylococcus americanisciuri]MCS4485290.1 sigma-70 family RNA polymerase sigma factor [Staphylococcus americanisciuri]
MDFDIMYQRYYKYIHYLLNTHHIHYNYDEYYQLLCIRLWELCQSYDASKNTNLHAYLTYRLKFYLIDLLRKQARQPLLDSIDTPDLQLPQFKIDDKLFSIQQWALQLPFTHRHWLYLYLQGYTQLEIATYLSRSPSSVKNYKKQTLSALRHSHFSDY